MCITVPDLCEKLQSLLMEDAQELGRRSGFIKRERKFSGASFAQTLVFGWLATPQASLEDLCQSASSCGVHISPQGLQNRLGAEAAAFLKVLLERSLTYLVEAEGASIAFLEQFEGVYIQDSSILALPRELAEVWQGSGNQTGALASLKLQTVFEYQHGQLHLALYPGRVHDSRVPQATLPPKALHLADTGYFKVDLFRQLGQHGSYWLTRVPARVGVWVKGQVVPLATWLAQQGQERIDTAVDLSAQQLPCRLIAERVPPEIAQQRRERALADAKANARQVREVTLALCEWTVLATNLPLEALSPQQAILLMRLPWQIELLFKLWKQGLGFARPRSRQPHQILCEVYAKLLAVVVQHWILLIGCWDHADRSLFKAVQVLRKHALHLAVSLPYLPRLADALHTLLFSMQRCKVQKRRAKPATFQLLDLAFP
jgi:hypothetical protein